MFHTPPTKESWSSHDALENSYTTPTTETTKTTVTASNNINDSTATSKLSQVSNNLPEHTAAASPSEDTHVDDISSTSTDSNTSNPDDSTSTITKDSTDENANANANYTKKDDEIQKLKIDDQNSQFLQPVQETNDKTKASPAIKATHSNDNINDNINEQLLTILNQEELLDDKDDALPEELESLLDHFYKYLKEPRFATPPSTLQISELFQKFYLKCYEKNVEYVRNNFTSTQNDDNNSNNNSNNLIALLTPQEIEEERKLNHLKQSLIYKYNLIIEKKSCDKFYNSIVYPQKDVPNDQFEQLIDAQFNEKLYYLNRLLINFNTLDIDINCEEEFFVVKLEEKILPQFELMLVERSPTLKLKILDRIHELYSDLVDEVTTSPKSTTSKPVYLIDASTESSASTASTVTTADAKQEKHHKKALNTDVYLPLLIYTIIKLPDLQTHSLILQLEFIKRFRNNLLYDTDLLTDDKYSEEKGRLLYILTNFEASLMYLCSVTLTNLSLELNPMIIRDIYPTIKKDPELIMSLLNTPIEIESIKESEYDPFTTIHSKRYNQSLKNNSNNKYSSKPNSSFLSIGLPNVSSSDFNLYNADQGLKSISSTVDLGLRSIFGKAADWISTHEQQQQLQQQQQQELQEQQQHQQQQQLQQELGQDQEQYEEQQQSYNENDLNDTLKQLSENFAFQQQQEEVSQKQKQFSQDNDNDNNNDTNNDNDNEKDKIPLSNNSASKLKTQTQTNNNNTEITPTSSISTTSTLQSNNQSNGSGNSNSSGNGSAINLNHTLPNAAQPSKSNNQLPLPERTLSNSSSNNNLLLNTVNSPSKDDKFLTKFASSVGGVMKNFRPISNSSSTTSLSNHLHNSDNANTNNGSSNTTPFNGSNVPQPTSPIVSANVNGLRSRAASLMNSSFFNNNNSNNSNNNGSNTSMNNSNNSSNAIYLPGSNSSTSNVSANNNTTNISTLVGGTATSVPQPSANTTSTPSAFPRLEKGNSIMSSLETAFENVRNRSRENSIAKNQHQHSSSLSQLISSNLNDLIIDRSPSKNDYFSSKNTNTSSANTTSESALRIEKLEKDSERLKIIKNDIKSFNNFKNKNFTDLSVAELSQIFNNYKFMIEEIEK